MNIEIFIKTFYKNIVFKGFIMAYEAETQKHGYHLKKIDNGVFGEFSKIQEEINELKDAINQDCKIQKEFLKMVSDNLYVCVMFPYPSAHGMHVGHYYNYAIIDSYCKWQRFFHKKNVFQPFGYDAFGLPAENYAKKVGGDARTITMENIENFRHQMQKMNTNFEEKLITCEPNYIKWSQFIFSKLREKGLAYKKFADVNWCPSCETVLANEQVVDDKCERCSSNVEQKNMNQWFFKITDYKDRLIKNLDFIDYPASTKKQQRHWLENQQDWCVSRQRKWGCPIPIEGETDTLDTFVDSSFYFLRYCTNNENEFLPKEDYKQVDLYIGGSEHSTKHLIFSRFIHMFLYDIGVVPVEEPFKKVIHQGMITKNKTKMSKSLGNVVNPDDFNPDELRMHLMFIGPYFEGGDWEDAQITGVRRFLNKMKSWLEKSSDAGVEFDFFDFKSKIDWNVERFKFNKVVSLFMETYNKNKDVILSKKSAKEMSDILKVFAPGFEYD
jgi:leucyl-tRNA synthetase